jgi:hypothetical protein
MKLDRIIEKIILKATIMENWRWRPGNKHNKPGALIESLTPDERETLKDAKPRDFDVRLK